MSHDAHLPPAQSKEDQALRTAIADVVHEVATEALGAEHGGLGSLQAFLGAVIATLFTGDKYEVMAGSFAIEVAEGRGFELDAQNPKTKGREFHVWAAAPPEGGQHALIMDLSARHYCQWLEAAGLACPHALDGLQFVWDFEDRLPSEIYYLADRETTVAVHEAFMRAIGPVRFKQLIATAAERMQRRGYKVKDLGRS